MLQEGFAQLGYDWQFFHVTACWIWSRLGSHLDYVGLAEGST